jgi:hypothetical protein
MADAAMHLLHRCALSQEEMEPDGVWLKAWVH